VEEILKMMLEVIQTQREQIKVQMETIQQLNLLILRPIPFSNSISQSQPVSIVPEEEQSPDYDEEIYIDGLWGEIHGELDRQDTGSEISP
jgi:hypothetical protein